MKLGSWKDGLRSARPLVVMEPEPPAVAGWPVMVSNPPLPESRAFTFDVSELVKRKALSVDVRGDVSDAMRELGHPGELLIEVDHHILDDSTSLLFYGASGDGERTKQVFPCRLQRDQVEVIITPFRESAMYQLMGQPDSLIDGTRLAMAAENDLQYLRGWPNGTRYEILHTTSPLKGSIKGFEGRVRFDLTSAGRPTLDFIYNASLDINGKLTATLPLFPYAHIEISNQYIEEMSR